MGDIIKKQLEKVSYADLSRYDEKTNTYYIPKYSKPTYEVGSGYLVKLPLELVNNKTSVIASNWNNSTAPAYQYLKIFVSKLLGKMIYVDSTGYDPETDQDIMKLWTGWLNVDELTQISRL